MRLEGYQIDEYEITDNENSPSVSAIDYLSLNESMEQQTKLDSSESKEKNVFVEICTYLFFSGLRKIWTSFVCINVPICTNTPEYPTSSSPLTHSSVTSMKVILRVHN